MTNGWVSVIAPLETFSLSLSIPCLRAELGTYTAQAFVDLGQIHVAHRYASSLQSLLKRLEWVQAYVSGKSLLALMDTMRASGSQAQFLGLRVAGNH